MDSKLVSRPSLVGVLLTRGGSKRISIRRPSRLDGAFMLMDRRKKLGEGWKAEDRGSRGRVLSSDESHSEGGERISIATDEGGRAWA